VIFVTVGGQLPFDRLIHTLDHWAADEHRSDVFAQIGSSQSPPTHIQWQRFLSPMEFQAKARGADVIIAHAGMGSILTALDFGKPIIVMPRRAHLGEHRNDHQWATVHRLGADVGIVVAANEEELVGHLGRLEELQSPGKRHSQEYTRLLTFLRNAISSSE
jgi:UDP-N-acetylglucosamine transferase subunit ALG13